jgi:hypothetical protein
MKEVFIRGNDERSSEVIKVLENLGGKRDCNSIGTGYYYLYYLDKDNYITSIHQSETLGLVMQKYFEELHLPEPIKELPNTWEEWCKKCVRDEFVYIDGYGDAVPISSPFAPIICPTAYKNLIKDEPRAKAFIALMQLMNLRDEYRQGWKPNYDDNSDKYVITYYNTAITCDMFIHYNAILSFQSAEIRDKFYANFKDLIEQAKEFI